mmetsp:Transcript_28174/g.53662  ORF Transcript_28174/g.53662 Transcript_28174/m.53662 type:complete len:144 (+) Transcript_28174:176-607(+)
MQLWGQYNNFTFDQSACGVEAHPNKPASSEDVRGHKPASDNAEPPAFVHTAYFDIGPSASVAIPNPQAQSLRGYGRKRCCPGAATLHQKCFIRWSKAKGPGLATTSWLALPAKSPPLESPRNPDKPLESRPTFHLLRVFFWSW